MGLDGREVRRLTHVSKAKQAPASPARAACHRVPAATDQVSRLARCAFAIIRASPRFLQGASRNPRLPLASGRSPLGCCAYYTTLDLPRVISRAAFTPHAPIEPRCRVKRFFRDQKLTGYPIGLCRRRGWQDPSYECYRDPSGYTCLVLVNGREYQTDLAYESNSLAQENAAMRAFMVCRNFSVNGGMLARNGIVQGLPANDSGKRKKSRHASASHAPSHRESRHSRCGHSSSSSTVSFE